MTPASESPILPQPSSPGSSECSEGTIRAVLARWQSRATEPARRSLRSGSPFRRLYDRAVCRALFCGLVCFAAIQIAICIASEGSYPELRDPEYGYKLAALRCRLAEAPGRPLLLAMGSSRTLNGFAPALLANGYPDHEIPAVLFNFGLTASGPFREYLCTERLLRQGIRPRWLIIEIMPPFLSLDNFCTVEQTYPFGRLSWNDLEFLRPHADSPWLVYPEWLQERMLVTYTQRFCLMHRCAPDWCPQDSAINGFLHGVDGSGWLANAIHEVDAGTFQRGVAEARIEYPEPLFAGFHIAPQADVALRELLALCGRENITPLLLLMPEGSIFQSWYPPQAKACLRQYLDLLRYRYGVPVIDARSWVPDSGFMDGHHLTIDGAAVFNAHFARSVLRPLLGGQ